MNEIHQWRVPGRVNLLGDHTDHAGGMALPVAIDRGITLKVRRRSDDRIAIWSDLGHAEFDRHGSEAVTGWATPIAGSVWALAGHGITGTGVDIVIDSDLPVGSGLASSASICCATVLALATLAGVDLDPATAARLAARAENDYVGAPTGLLDQWAICFAQAGQALWLDFAEPEPAATPVPVAWAEAALALVVIDTATRHDHATSGYAQRREELESARVALGVDQVSQAGLDQIVRLSDPVLKARTQHVFTENTRVRAGVRALNEGAWAQFGALMTASHLSLRDDFQVSCEQVDTAVELALERGALGARMTGGGFGGCAIALLPPERIEQLRSMLEARFVAHEWARPSVVAVHAAAGPRRISATAPGRVVG